MGDDVVEFPRGRAMRGRDFLDCWLGSCRRGNRRPITVWEVGRPSQAISQVALKIHPRNTKFLQFGGQPNMKRQSLPQALARKRQLTKSSPHDAAYPGGHWPAVWTSVHDDVALPPLALTHVVED